MAKFLRSTSGTACKSGYFCLLLSPVPPDGWPEVLVIYSVGGHGHLGRSQFVCVCVFVELHGMKDLSFLGLNPRPLHWKRRALTIESPWTSQVVLRFWRCEFVSSKRLCADLYVDTCFHFSGGNTSGWDCGSQAHVWLYKKPPSSCPEQLHCPASPMAFRESCHRPKSF